ncbi:SDR family oxidoreductase [Paraburkholderia caffeinilytica]|uniref:Short-chain type dehydrogenase/reductase y4lA n=1 Tax=Paraburkholderia caffeinilytica TaxID=1761016 RepID=A0ABQ1LMF5_9BURK|nr:glucose 1-dehydrogenase [Paraburkholderia caffeinilytica]AXL53683.1 SDR family oxidoreductase [Paraburkholderia caffeinilytica]GGC26989.1 putative short-chain type dehydrogenase/reductase y4lA [Paraburkholderia caffeinilytica]CAB3779976.1 2,5-dichloro-2,5-cyclohexadiene-1,4-diol dehydrogenase [Paraburkholderia caffeinilytica]
MKVLEKKIAVITGAGSGIGEATAHRLAEEGAAVVIADLDGEAAHRVAVAIAARDGQAIAIRTDIADEAQIRAMTEAARQRFGGIDLLFNNAAVTSAAHFARDLDVIQMDVETWDRTMNINVRGAMLCCKYAIPQMLERGGGAVINMASGLGLFGDLTRTAYGTSKAALIGLTRFIATQYGKQGVRANTIAAGLIGTDAVKTNLSRQELDFLLEHQLSPSLGEPSDIAATVVFLASDAGRFITGQTIPVDGGFSAHVPQYADVARMIAQSSAA